MNVFPGQHYMGKKGQPHVVIMSEGRYFSDEGQPSEDVIIYHLWGESSLAKPFVRKKEQFLRDFKQVFPRDALKP
jgi:hypothetical protein